ncbi:MJ1255/VC2487 family glycosyltransferase [Permianibacter aggregans]|uniref:Uncharacterized protein (TIGR00661 family) n=1 Tax=Permianibacter aggregans TaxID=1510150 RepID=A0A4V3D817_9GAMM|nr:MJ1255/VC2487 family glycosyltransferase [Permianibacter aggregans]QGX39359.1 glycosyl transferase [Permianibacter aggregans]TDQ49907.1 uncharacterized protein (TIGR00661 family) [Permianibacter aggregans]
MMRLLYGVQGTGNGHLTRARAMLPALRDCGFEVDVLVSGRDRLALFGTESFGDFQWRQGMSFVMEKGHIAPLKTLVNLQLKRFFRDVSALSLAQYDLVVTDFEPVTAWAAMRQRVRCVGLGHQYAFRHRIPTKGINIPSRLTMRYFAPVDQPIGLHWHHFGEPILPPILEAFSAPVEVRDNHFLVYLPFEDTADLLALLKPFSQCHFDLYAGVSQREQHGNVTVHPFSREGFAQHLLHCEGVITGAGFELPSEAIVLGKKLLVRPLQAQLEQESNAKALQLLQRADVMHRLEPEAVARLLAQPASTPVVYPNVAQKVARWLSAASPQPVAELARECWQQTQGIELMAKHLPAPQTIIAAAQRG